MLSTIGRASVRRVVARGPQSTNRVLQNIWQLQRFDTPHNADNASSQPRFSFSLRRSYATATKVATKAKPQATKPARAKPKTKSSTKKAVKKKVAKKTKPKAKKPVKKVLTEEQKLKAALKDLKTKALSLPKGKPSTAWAVLLAEYVQANANGGNAASYSAAASSKYKSLSADELEVYNHTANQNKTANAIALKQWTESHTPEQIRIANNARKQLQKKEPKKQWSTIQDTRIPKQPAKARILYQSERWASGDLKSIPFGEASSLITKEWQSLPASQRKVYEDRENEDQQRYIKEFKKAFDREPPLVQRNAA